MGTVKIKLPLTLVLNDDFKSIFQRLCADPAVAKKDCWWLVRSGKRIEAGINLFNERRRQITVRHGIQDKEKGEHYTVPKEAVPNWQHDVNQMVDTFEPIETFLEAPLRLLDPLPADSKLTAADLSILMEVGLVFNPDANENPSTQIPEEAPKESGESRL